jgi:hypothetical protein
VPGEGGETGTQREINGVSSYRIRFIQYATSVTTGAFVRTFIGIFAKSPLRGRARWIVFSEQSRKEER